MYKVELDFNGKFWFATVSKWQQKTLTIFKAIQNNWSNLNIRHLRLYSTFAQLRV